MIKPGMQEKIQEMANKIAQEFKPEKIILFGSYAWGEPHEDSDVDLFIVKDSSEKRIERARKARSAIWGMGVPVDILVYTPKEIRRRLEKGDFFIKDIIAKGKVLYAQS